MPILPLYIFYIFVGSENFHFFHSRVKKYLLMSLTILIFATYITKYTTVNWGSLQGRFDTDETIELFDYINENTDKDSVFIFRKPTVLAILTVLII